MVSSAGVGDIAMSSPYALPKAVLLSPESGSACSCPHVLSLFELLGCGEDKCGGTVVSVSGGCVCQEVVVEAADRGHDSSFLCGQLDIDAGVAVESRLPTAPKG